MKNYAYGVLAAPSLIIPLALLLAGCTHSTTRYTFVYLKTGPESAHKTPEESKSIFQGHMANMRRLADVRQLLIAGPFDKPAEKSWRGIFILDVSEPDAARELVNTDPGIQSGVFIQENHPFTSNHDLRRTIELEKHLTAARAANPADPPRNIRCYIMITATDAARARAALASSPLAKSIIFSGTFSDTRAAVFVLDSESAEDIQTRIAEHHLDLGPVSIDRWWSTTSLANLNTRMPDNAM